MVACFHSPISFLQLSHPNTVEGLVLVNIDPNAKGWMDWAAHKVRSIFFFFFLKGSFTLCVVNCISLHWMNASDCQGTQKTIVIYVTLQYWCNMHSAAVLNVAFLPFSIPHCMTLHMNKVSLWEICQIQLRGWRKKVVRCAEMCITLLYAKTGSALVCTVSDFVLLLRLV